ncbi:MAG: hypothetical protein GX443_06095 [Deltaproteobacteria bacterium]|nr:hypothetical protein [Deltaproteobacteria bacterium]
MQARCVLTVAVFLFLLVSPALAGSYGPYFPCTPPERDTFGDAFRMARDSQVLNPDASSNLDPVKGLEGRVAEKIHEKYVDALGKKMGGGTGSGGTVGFVPLLTGGMGQ